MLQRGRAPADRGRRRHHQRRRQRAAGGVRRADRRAGDPDADGLGHHPRRPPADGRHVRPADQPPLRQRHHAGQRLRAGHRQPLGQPPHRLGRGLHARAASSCTSTSSRRRSAACSRPTSASSPTPRPRSSCSSQVARELQGRRQAAGPRRLGRASASERKRTMLRKTNFDDVPMKPQRVYQCMNKRLRRRHLLRQHHRPVADRRRAVPARLQAAPLDQLRPGRPAGLDHSGRAGRARGRPDAQDRRAVGRLRLPVHDRGAGRGRAVQAALHPHGGEQLLPGPDPPVAARLRDGLLRAARLRQHQHAGRRPAPSAATASTTSRWSRAWAARPSACTGRKRLRPPSRRPRPG